MIIDVYILHTLYAENNRHALHCDLCGLRIFITCTLACETACGKHVVLSDDEHDYFVNK